VEDASAGAGAHLANGVLMPAPAEPVPAELLPAEPVPAEPVPAEPVPAEPLPAEPLPAEPLPAVPRELPDDEWFSALQSSGAAHAAAVERLYALLLLACRSETRRRAGRTGLSPADVDDLAQQAAADATLAVLGKLDTFRAESRFTPWVNAFAVFEVSAVIGRHLRRTVGARLDEAAWEFLPDRWGAGPAEQAHARELAALLRRVVDEQLTPRQPAIFTAIVVEGTPLDVLAAELRTSRNAIYKTVFDARRKIRDTFAANGYLESGAGRRST
jgi:RNA polymerase sigma-70 factor (ECF subfamily)